MDTEREGHAREVVQALSLAELQTYDGIVAVIASSKSHDMLTTSRFLLFPSGSDRLLCSCVCMCSQLLDRGGQQKRSKVPAALPACPQTGTASITLSSRLKVWRLTKSYACVACLQVGGDGLFQEVLNGLLSIRGAGGKAGQVAAHLRLGHIPAGSTDAVAFSLNGTRSQATAALHIALGDRRALSLLLTPSNPSNYYFTAILTRISRLVALQQFFRQTSSSTLFPFTFSVNHT